MTTHLILWRHAEAEEASASLPDAKRRLTPRGEQQARDMARWLKTRLPKKIRVLVSPAVRTQQTAHALALPFEIEPRVDIGAEPANLLAASGWADGPGAVMLVGHQPALGQLAALLLGGAPMDWSVKKGGLWWLTRRNRELQDQTVLKAVINPELLR
jgi:phosphohistidine phosphatase